MSIKKSIYLMRLAVKAFGRLAHPADQWFVASLLLRYYPEAVREALRMTPEFRP